MDFPGKHIFILSVILFENVTILPILPLLRLIWVVSVVDGISVYLLKQQLNQYYNNSEYDHEVSQSQTADKPVAS